MNGRGRGRGKERGAQEYLNSYDKGSGGRNPFASQQHSQIQVQSNLLAQQQQIHNQTKAKSYTTGNNPFFISPSKTENKIEGSRVGIKSNFNPFAKGVVQPPPSYPAVTGQPQVYPQSGSRFVSSNNFSKNSNYHHSLMTNSFRAEVSTDKSSNPFFRSASSSSIVQNFSFSSPKEIEAAASVSLEKLSNILSPKAVEISIDIAELKSAPRDETKGGGKVSQLVRSDQSSNGISGSNQIEIVRTTADRADSSSRLTGDDIENPFASYSANPPESGSEYDFLVKSEFKLGRIPTTPPITT